MKSESKTATVDSKMPATVPSLKITERGYLAVGGNKFRYSEYGLEIPKRVRNDAMQRTFWSALQFCLIIFDEKIIENCNGRFKNARHSGAVENHGTEAEGGTADIWLRA